MILNTGKDNLVAEWIAARIPYLRGQGLGPCVCFHVTNDDRTKILGAVAFQNHRPEYRAIEWTAAADTANWLSPKIINMIMRYPFDQLGCRRITAFIAESNHRSRDFQQRFGFKQEGRLRRFINAREDMLIFGLLQSDWKKSPFNLKREAAQPRATLEMSAN
jgi:RimJ/RimL family protein N-acetyltransferase